MKHETKAVSIGYGCTCHYWTANWDEFNAHLEEHWREEEDED